MIKILGVVGVGRAYLDTIKTTQENISVNAMFSSEKQGLSL